MWKNKKLVMSNCTQKNSIIAKIVMSKYLLILLYMFLFTELPGYCTDEIGTIKGSRNVNVVFRNSGWYVTRSPKAWGNITIPRIAVVTTEHALVSDAVIIGIEDEAFMDSQVESVIYEGLETFEIGKSVFKNCKKLKSFKVTPYNSYVGVRVTGIGAEAFAGCEKLSSISYAPNFPSIGDRAFSGCVSLTNIPGFIGKIGDYVFENCNSLSDVNIVFQNDTIGKGIFKGCKNLKRVVWPFRIIPEETFANCSNLTSISASYEAIQIKSHAFENCTSLSNLDAYLNLAKSVEIGDSAFYNCQNLDHIKEGVVKNIGNSAFENCTKLKTFIPATDEATSWGTSAFRNCKNLTSIRIPDCLKSIGDNTFEGCALLQAIQIPHSVKQIGPCAFKDCKNISSIWIPNSVTEVGDNLFENVHPKIVAVPNNVFMQINQDSISSVIMQDAYSDYLYNASSNLSFIDFSMGVDAIAPYAFFGIGNVAIHLPTGVKSYADDFLAGSNVAACNIPADMHEWKYDLPDTNVTFFVETDSLYMANSLREGDKMIGVNPTSNVKIIVKDNQSKVGGKWYGNFSYYTKNEEELPADMTPDKNGVEDKTLELYDLLRVGAIVRDSTARQSDAFYNTTIDKRNMLYKTLEQIYPFKDLMSMPLSKLQVKYDSLDTAMNEVLNISPSDFNSLKPMKLDLQSLYHKCTELYSSNIFPYIDADVKANFESAMDKAQSSIGEISEHTETMATLRDLQTSYDTIVVVVNRYNEALSESKEQLQTLVANGNRLRETDYADIYPYIDSNARNSLEAALAAADPESYDLQKVQSAKSELQTAYDTIVAVINRYSAALSESKGQLQTLVTNSSELGKTAYTDVYPYIDSEAKNSLEAALAAANPESFDLQNIQTSLNQLQTAYDQMMALINTYSNDLTTAKQTLQQRLDEEGGLKDNSEFPFIDANLQKAYEDALKSATTAINGYDLAAINSAIEPLHQAYDKASKAMASLIGELAPAKSVLQTQINKCNDYLNDKPYYFTADYLTQLRSGAQRAEAVINTSDVNTIRQHITKLNTLFSEVDADIIANKNKVKQMQDSFARVFALMDTLKTIGLYDQAGERISPSGDLKEFSLFTFDGTSNGYNKCLQTIKSAQGIAVYMGASNSGFFDEGVIDYTNKCTDFINRFETEFASLDAKYQQEKGKLQEAIQRLQSLKEDNPTAYAKVDDNLKSQVEAKLTEWNVSGYAEVGRVYANADFSICDELQQAIGAYESLKENLSKMLANISKDCQTIANGANMNDVAVRSNYRVGDGLVTQEDQVSVIMGGKRTLIDGDSDTKVTLFSSAKTIDLDLTKECSNVVLAFANDESSLEHHFKVYATNNAQDNSSWKLQSEFVNTYSRKISQKYVARQFVGLDDNYRYLRIEFVPTDECPKTTISELRVYHRANKFESEGADSCTQFFRLVAELQAQVDNQQEPSLESYEKVSAAYARFNAFEDSENFGLADFKETTAATYFNANKAVSLPHEVVGSIITGKNGRIVRDTRFDETHPVPANTAVVLQGEGGCSYYLIPTTDYVASVGGNLLHGMSADGTTQVTESEAKYYKFNKGTFAWAKENGAAFSAKAGDVFLAIPTGMEQLESYDFGSIYGIGDNVPPYTGIGEITVSYKRKGIYDLNGRPINVKDSRDLMPGIYIVDGKKVVVK